MSAKTTKIIGWICRVVTAAVFIFSGIVKSFDPWGTAMKIGEYLSALGLESLDFLTLPGAVLLCGGELVLGLVVLFRVRPRESSFMMMVAMTFFSLTTLWVAITNPVADCGCFGDAIKLTNWQTFFKNLILLPMAVFLFMQNRKTKLKWSTERLSALACIAVVSFGLCIYSICYLPPVDFLPYKVGVDLLAQDNGDDSWEDVEVKTTLIYKDKQSGENHEFTLEDTQWQDTTRWEFVDTIIDDPSINKSDALNAVAEFALFDSGEKTTREIIEGKDLVLICLWDAEQPISKRCLDKLKAEAIEANIAGYRPVVVTPTALGKVPYIDINGSVLMGYNIDNKTLKSLMRSPVGIVWLHNGVISRKSSCCSCGF